MDNSIPNFKAEKASNEIGDSKSSYTLQYFSITKFIKTNGISTKLKKIICIYYLCSKSYLQFFFRDKFCFQISNCYKFFLFST